MNAPTHCSRSRTRAEESRRLFNSEFLSTIRAAELDELAPLVPKGSRVLEFGAGRSEQGEEAGESRLQWPLGARSQARQLVRRAQALAADGYCAFLRSNCDCLRYTPLDACLSH